MTQKKYPNSIYVPRWQFEKIINFEYVAYRIRASKMLEQFLQENMEYQNTDWNINLYKKKEHAAIIKFYTSPDEYAICRVHQATIGQFTKMVVRIV